MVTRETGVCFMVLNRMSPEKSGVDGAVTPNEHLFLSNLSLHKQEISKTQFPLYMVCVLLNASHLQYNSVAISTLLLPFED